MEKGTSLVVLRGRPGVETGTQLVFQFDCRGPTGATQRVQQSQALCVAVLPRRAAERPVPAAFKGGHSTFRSQIKQNVSFPSPLPVPPRVRIGRKITSVFPGPSPCPLPQGERGSRRSYFSVDPKGLPAVAVGSCCAALVESLGIQRGSARLQGTGQGSAFQISAAYWSMVRSLEKLPDEPTLIIALRAQASGSLNNWPTRV